MKSLKLMNYTSVVPAEKSILEIEKLLARAGASKIAKDYAGDGTVIAFIFTFDLPSGHVLFRMPCDVEKVYEIFMAEYRQPQRDTEERVREKAHRVAWRIMLDWVESQITMIRLGQVKPQQVFLPYAWDARTGQTLYEKLEAQNFNFALKSGKEKD